MDSSPCDVSPFISANGGPDLNGVPPSGPARAQRLPLYLRLLRMLLPETGLPLPISLWNGAQLGATAGTAVPHLRIRDFRTLLQLLVNPDLGFGDAYSDGRIEVEGDLLAFLEQAFRTRLPSPAPIVFLRRFLARFVARPRTNSLKGSLDNIHSHYNLGNDFYRLWLDEQLVYTCAYFPTPDVTLEEAQRAKMDHVCRKLQLRPGENVVEAGCGWGALGLHMARHYGVRVTAFNISREQIAHARERARQEGLAGQVQFVQDDYRNITGRFDAFVSVGMLEHVGLSHYRDLGAVIHRCLKPAGRGLIHSIGRNRPAPTNAWLEKRIFPGAYMPSLREMMRVFEPWDFSVLDVENLRLHYARTLEHWWRRFEAVSGRVADMFDQRFVRAWRLYLVSSMAGFTTGNIQLFQVLFAPAANNAIPWTRAPVYEKEAEIIREPRRRPSGTGAPGRAVSSV